MKPARLAKRLYMRLTKRVLCNIEYPCHQPRDECLVYECVTIVMGLYSLCFESIDDIFSSTCKKAQHVYLRAILLHMFLYLSTLDVW